MARCQHVEPSVGPEGNEKERLNQKGYTDLDCTCHEGIKSDQ